MNQYKLSDGASKSSKSFRNLLICSVAFTLLEILLDIANVFIYARSLYMVDMFVLIENAIILIISIGMLGYRRIQDARISKIKVAIGMIVMATTHLVQVLSSASAFLVLGSIYRLTYWCLWMLVIAMLAVAATLFFCKKDTKAIVFTVGIVTLILVLIYVFDFLRFLQYINEAWLSEIVNNILYRVADLGLVCFFSMLFILFWARPDCLKKTVSARAIPKAELELLKAKLEIGAITEEQYRQQIEQLKYPS